MFLEMQAMSEESARRALPNHELVSRSGALSGDRLLHRRRRLVRSDVSTIVFVARACYESRRIRVYSTITQWFDDFYEAERT